MVYRNYFMNNLYKNYGAQLGLKLANHWIEVGDKEEACEILSSILQKKYWKLTDKKINSFTV